MDASSLISSSKRREHTFVVNWDIYRINSLLKLYNYRISSHLIKIFHDGLSFWRLAIFPVPNGLQIFLVRALELADEHGTIFIRYNVCLVNQQCQVYFEDVSDILAYKNPVSSTMLREQSFDLEPQLKSKIFVHKNLLDIHGSNLHVQFEITLFWDDDELQDRNSNYDLHSLARDLKNLVHKDFFHDVFLHSGGVHYGLNSSLMQARLPRFHFLMETYHLIVKGFTAAEKKEAECTLWDEAEKPIPMTSWHVYDGTLARAMFIVWKQMPTDPFIKPVDMSIDILRQSFTPTVCRALVSFLCTGSVELECHADVVRLSNIARCLFLYDLVHKLEGYPRGCHSATEMVSMGRRYCMSPHVFRKWRENNYSPIVKTFTLTERTRVHEMKLIVTLCLNRNSGVMGLECAFPENTLLAAPLLLIVKLNVKDSRGHLLKSTKKTQVYYHNTRWSLDLDIGEELLALNSMECLFFVFCAYKTELTWPDYERFESYKAGVTVRSVRCLSVNLWNSFYNRLSCDVMLVAKGCTLPAHIYILCARSGRFLYELGPKLNAGHTITHLVPEIEYRTLVEMVKYMYTGDLVLENSYSVEKLLFAAVDFDVPPLVNLCNLFLTDKNSD